MELTIKERLFFADLFECNGDSFAEAQLRKSLIEKIAIGFDEQKAINFKSDGINMTWDNVEPVEFDFSETELAYLKESAITLSKGRRVTQNILSVVAKLYNSINN